jgi:hypothetical protein
MAQATGPLSSPGSSSSSLHPPFLLSTRNNNRLLWVPLLVLSLESAIPLDPEETGGPGTEAARGRRGLHPPPPTACVIKELFFKLLWIFLL